MESVYQRPRALPFAGALLLAALAAAGCGERPPAAARDLDLAPRRDPLTAFLACSWFEPAAGDPAGRLAGTRWAATGPRAVWLGPAAGAVTPLLPGEPGASRALAQLDGERALVELAMAAPGEAPSWLLAGPGPASRRIGPPAGERWRFLGRAARSALYAAATPDAGGPERLLEIGPGGETRALAVAPPGLEFAAVSPDGLRVALRRARDERSDEIFLLERTTGETTLLLPEAEEGRFRPLAFAPDGQALLLLSDDRSDLARAEWMELDSRRRTPALEADCAVIDAHLAATDGSVAFELSCQGRTEVVVHPAGGGAPLAAASVPGGERAVAAWPAPVGGPLLYAVAGPRWPRDLWRSAGDARAEPLTYGLAAAIDPADLVESEPLALPTPDGDLPAELWRPRRAGPGGWHAGLLWLESDARPPRWFELEPLAQFLAQRGVAVVRLRPRGADGFGRRFRALGDGRRGEVELFDVEVARRALVERGGADPARLALLGEGAWNGALAAAVATRAEPAFALVIALDPDPDPLAAALAPPVAAPSAAPTRPSSPPDPALVRRREALRLGAAPARQPLRVVGDPATPRGLAARAALDAALASGTGVRWFEVATPPLGAPRLDARTLSLLVDELRPLYAAPPAP